MAGFSVTMQDAQLWEFAQNYPIALKNAVRSSVRTTTTFAKKQTDKQLTDVYFTPPKTLKNFRDKSKYYELRDGATFRGRIWVGSNDIKAVSSGDNSFLGRLSEFEGGAQAGKYLFAGGFIPKLKSGHKAIFKRVQRGTKIGKRGKTIIDYVLQKQSIAMDKTDAKIGEISVDMSLELANRFDAKIRHYLQTGYIPSGDD
ncbi:MAG: hypothetical protein PHD53_00125 [Methylococcales bacterium]|nr:hypothetical protein [Methylococcales bacterium]